MQVNQNSFLLEFSRRFNPLNLSKYYQFVSKKLEGGGWGGVISILVRKNWNGRFSSHLEITKTMKKQVQIFNQSSKNGKYVPVLKLGIKHINYETT